MHSVELDQIAPADQRQPPLDLFWIFAGANIVATTLQVGASLPSMPLAAALAVIAAGSVGGALLVAVLAPVGARLRVPSIVATRAALGYQGAQLVAVLLFLTNFVWIAVNNVIAASVTTRLLGSDQQELWALAFGVVATIIVLGGPRAVGLADRVAVPMLFVAGVALTVACLRAPWPAAGVEAWEWTAGLRGFDIVFGYQTSWLLMFGDYPRYSPPRRRVPVAVFAGLGLTALWFIPLGLVASTVARSADPGAMVDGVGLGWWGAVLFVLGTLTTNFVNIYMSALALKSVRPTTRGPAAILAIGAIGGVLSLLSSVWLDQLASFMLVLAGLFVPVGGVLVAHFLVRRHVDSVAALYPSEGGGSPRVGAWSVAGLIAWAVGGATFYLAQPIGGVVPAFVASIATYLVVARSAR